MRPRPCAHRFRGKRVGDKRGVDRTVDDAVRDVQPAWGPARAPCFAPAREVRACRRRTPRSPTPPRTLAVAPVKMIVPRPRGIMRRAASRPVRKPASAHNSQILRYLRAVSSRIGAGTLAPMLKTRTSTAPDVALDTREQLDHRILVACIARCRDRLAARRLDLGDQRRQRVRRAPDNDRGEAFAREALRHRAAGCVTRADHDRGGHQPCPPSTGVAISSTSTPPVSRGWTKITGTRWAPIRARRCRARSRHDCASRRARR